MAKIFRLPKSAFKCEGREQVGGHVFTDGQMVVSDDIAQLIFRKLTTFYGCTVETVVEEETTSDNGEQDPNLTTDETKQGE